MRGIVGKQFSADLPDAPLKLQMLPVTTHNSGTEWFDHIRKLEEGEGLEVNVYCEENTPHRMLASLRHFPICNLDLITFSSDEIQLPC